MNKRIFRKYSGNPVFSASDLPADIMYTLNPGAIKRNGEYIMMLDAATLSTPIIFWLARSSDGVNFTADPEPVNWPASPEGYTERCVFDPRITEINGEYIINFCSLSVEYDTSPGVVKTKDFKYFERLNPDKFSETNNRNCVLFPEKINGKYVRLERPMESFDKTSGMWIGYSDDLRNWGGSRKLFDVRRGRWDNFKIGAGAVPIKTEKGWLEIYHGVDKTNNGNIYRLGVCMLDLEDPSKVVGRCEDAIMWPEFDYELSGRVDNVVFTCNAILEANGTVKTYYGAADTCVGMAEANLEDLINECFRKNSYLDSFFKNS